jgi:hypothetical protein
LHAASGKVSAQSQSHVTKITADKLITVASVSKSVTVATKVHVMLTAQGAFLKLEGGNIMIHGPGTMTFKASMKELTGPANANSLAVRLPTAGELLSMDKPIFSQQFDLSHFAINDPTGFSSEMMPYRIFDSTGVLLASRVTNESGLTDRILTNEAKDISLCVGGQGWSVEEYFEDVDDNYEVGCFGGRVIFLDKHRNAISGLSYALEFCGRSVEGKTEADGLSKRIVTDRASDKVRILIERLDGTRKELAFVKSGYGNKLVATVSESIMVTAKTEKYPVSNASPPKKRLYYSSV